MEPQLTPAGEPPPNVAISLPVIEHSSSLVLPARASKAYGASEPSEAEETHNIFVRRMEEEGKWRKATIPAEIVGLTRSVDIYWATRKSNLITYDWHGDNDTFCPPVWWDLGIGSGACGLGCRSCFLMLTFRSMRDPLCPVVYENVEDFWKASEKWLLNERRRKPHTLGLGIDRADSLLYEGVTRHARSLIPIFADPRKNPKGNLLVLLTKSSNVHYLEGLPTENVAVTFSINPEPIADLWEGKWPDTAERITPSIDKRLFACLKAQELGFEMRWRLDPILAPPGWKKMYEDFFRQAAQMGLNPRYITLGTHREKNMQLDLWRKKWGLPELEWMPQEVVRDGTHFHVPVQTRVEIYTHISELAKKYLLHSKISLCKETHEVRRLVDLNNADCNCLT